MNEPVAQQENLTCAECGSTSFILQPSDLHGFGVRCASCGKFSRWTGKGKEKKNNPKHRKRHRKEGEMVCDWCGITESDAKEMGLHFAIDHREAEDFGGTDEFENTRPLCSACHYEKTAAEHRSRGIMKLLEKLQERKKMFTDYLDRPGSTIKPGDIDDLPF